MKVLQKVCPHCGYLMLFSVAVISDPGTAELIGPKCPACKERLSQAATITEIDIAEEAATLIREYRAPG